MKTKWAAVLLAVMACGGDDSTSGPGSAVTFSGTWHGSGAPAFANGADGLGHEMQLTQTGDSVHGTFIYVAVADPCAHEPAWRDATCEHVMVIRAALNEFSVFLGEGDYIYRSAHLVDGEPVWQDTLKVWTNCFEVFGQVIDGGRLSVDMRGRSRVNTACPPDFVFIDDMLPGPSPLKP